MTWSTQHYNQIYNKIDSYLNESLEDKTVFEFTKDYQAQFIIIDPVDPETAMEDLIYDVKKIFKEMGLKTRYTEDVDIENRCCTINVYFLVDAH